MNDWLAQNSVAVLFGLAAIAAAALVAAVVFLVLWLRGRRLRGARSEAEWTRIDRELSLAEHEGRLRIIRELQDIAISSLSTLITHAEGARYAAEGDPRAAVRAASSIVERGRVVLGDLRRVLTVVREGEAVSAPQPSLPSARDLFRVMHEAGLKITFTESGDRFELKPGAELAVFRILQGALENALKHGGTGTQVTVGFRWGAEGLQVSIDDDGIRAAARRAGLSPDQIDQATQYGIDDDLRALTESITGSGLSEMRQRTRLFGGVLNARVVPGVGFSVSAAFPALRFHNGVHGVDLSRR